MATGHAYDSDGRPRDRRRDHLADDGIRLQEVGRAGGHRRPLRGLREERRPRTSASCASTPTPAPASARSAAFDEVILDLANKTWQECLPWARPTATGTPRPACSRRPAATRHLLRPTGSGQARRDRRHVRRPLAGPAPHRLHRRGPAPGDEVLRQRRGATRRIVTEGGYKIQGTLAHRIKVVNPATACGSGSDSPTSSPAICSRSRCGTLVGGPREVPLPVLHQAYYTGDHHVQVPERHPILLSWSATSWVTAACTPRESDCACRF